MRINKQRFAIISTSSKNANQAAKSPNRYLVFVQNLIEMNLPTYRDFMKQCTYVRLKRRNKRNLKKQPSITKMATIVTKKLEAIWQKASIKIVSRTRIVQQVKNYHYKHRNSLKLYKTRQNNVNYEARIAKFQHEAGSLFEICVLNAKRKHSAVAQRS